MEHVAAAARTRPLAGLGAGSCGTIVRIPLDDPGMAAELAALRLLPGEPVGVIEVVPLGGPVVVQTAGGVYALGRRLAARIEVCDNP
ncbi:MAG: FeoA domain-containing protein [Armatimonadota bacterium]|nr:FeoA domain-containing protein [Armatimonadota bacterium]MDR7427371.1 FeoA domain-containing protein [Armatimonadota bacterium]MDR7465149.1 FeoA domain-containing protein [Armatimonadota bacterium]MDR7470082.1 FeoA domain-containing protein [Armatimonadota bacterium]MDR7474396.1 FeoA domain-containing protein [Armatimonadota bacterium]